MFARAQLRTGSAVGFWVAQYCISRSASTEEAWMSIFAVAVRRWISDVEGMGKIGSGHIGIGVREGS